jgi:uncharacterized membrane protein
VRYMQSGGFSSNPLMRLTIGFTILFLTGLVVSNFGFYFAKMNLNPSSVVAYYNGSEQEFRNARSYQSMLEVTHGHLAMMALVFLLLTHLFVFTPFSKSTKVSLIVVTFLSGLSDEGSGWLVRFVHPSFAWLKVISFLLLQASLIILLVTLSMFLVNASRETPEANTDKLSH